MPDPRRGLTASSGIRCGALVCLGQTPWCEDPAYAASGVLAVAVRVTLNGDLDDTSSNWRRTAYSRTRSLVSTTCSHGEAQSWVARSSSIIGVGLLAFGDESRLPLWHHRGSSAARSLNASERAIEAPLHTRIAFHDGRSVRSVVQQPGRLLTCTSPPATPSGAVLCD